MDKDNLEYRMYGLVPYNLSGIQAGIQYGHAVQEYNNIMIEKLLHEKHSNFGSRDYLVAFNKWREVDKTFIICNGGTTNEDSNDRFYGSLQQMRDKLVENDIIIAEFREPDLNDTLTAVVFLVDERVFDKKKYPDFELNHLDFPENSIGMSDYNKWLDMIGGKKNEFLRQFTDKSVMKLANN